jgi:Tfp pilus assembly protein PilO
MTNRYLTPMLVVVTALAVYFLYIDTAYTEVSQKLAAEKVIAVYLADAQQARSKLDKIIADYEAFPPSADARLRVLLPDTVDMIRLIIDVNAVAEKNGLTLGAPTASVGVPNPEQPGAYVSHTIRFELVATYPAFRIFLHDLQSSLAIRDFASISFKSPNQKDAADGEKVVRNPEFDPYEYDIELTTYSLR